LAEKLINFEAALHKESRLDHFELGYHLNWYGNIEHTRGCSENGRYIACRLKAGEMVLPSRIVPDGAAVVDLQNSKAVAQLNGALLIVAISPNGRTALTEPIHADEVFNRPPDRLTLWDLRTGTAMRELHSSEALRDELFYSADGQYVFAAARNWTTVDRFTWWRTDGQLVGDIVCPTGTDSGSSL